MKASKSYPYTNTDLDSLPKEQWDDLPGLEGYYEISSFGRVKRLYRETLCVNGNVMRFQEKMIRAFPERKYNKTVKEYIFFLSANLSIEKRKYKISIGRMVYYVFKEKFDLEDDYLVVYAKDGDGKNIRLPNLGLIDIKGRAKRIFERGRLKREILSTWDEYNNTGKLESENQACRQVSQYNDQGKYIKTYPSIRVASKVAGVPEAGIVSVLKDRQVIAGGFHWKYGKDRSKADVEGRRQKANENRRKLVGVTVSQYNSKGQLMRVFATIMDASSETGVSSADIHAVLSGRQRSAGGFIWRKGDGPRSIDLRGYSIGEQYRAERQRIPVGKFTDRGKLVKTYSSLKEASEQEGCTDSYLSIIISQKRFYQGFRFKKIASKVRK